MTLKTLIVFINFLIVAVNGISQVTITGETCVRAGGEYQYLLSGIQNDSTVINVCAEGGTVNGGDSSCMQGAALSFVRIAWNMESENGQVILSSGEGNDTLAVDIADTLNPGTIADDSKEQTVEIDSIPVTILCTKAKGGACRTQYSYQWQKSSDALHWTDIEGAEDKDLFFSAPFSETSYFRREVKEINSNYVDYSNIASVFIHSAAAQ